MLLGFKTELKLNKVQRVELAKHAGTARHAYNWGLGLCKQILWFISFKVEIEPISTPKKVDVVGIDLGVNHLATLSTGEVFDGAKSYKKYEKNLTRIQWLNRHKQIKSANWKKAQLKIARLHRKIANIRKDTLHKITTYIAKNHSVIGIEDLNVSGMMANHKLAKAIANMGFHEFGRLLEYKCQLYGSKLVAVDRFYPTSKTCSRCKAVKDSLALSERIYCCSECRTEIDRDLNASINLEMAVRSTVSACGLSKCRHSQNEAGRNVALRYTSCEQLLPILVSV